MQRLRLVADHVHLDPAPLLPTVTTAYYSQDSSPTATAHVSAAAVVRPDGHRLATVAVCTATPAPPSGELSAELLAQYCRDGFLLVSGLIPADTCVAAVDAMWAQMSAENRDCSGGSKTTLLPAGQRGDTCTHPTTSLPQNQRNEPTSWTGDGDWPVKDNAAVMAIFTPAYLRAAQLLAAAHARTALYPVVADPRVQPPTGGLAINRFPRHAVGPYPPPAAESSGGAWSTTRPSGYAPHSDHGYRPEDGTRHPPEWRTQPQPIRIQHFTFLEADANPGGAGTLVWPGSHHALARAYVEAEEGVTWMGGIEEVIMAFNLPLQELALTLWLPIV